MNLECLDCLKTNLKDPAHRIKEVDCADCIKIMEKK